MSSKQVKSVSGLEKELLLDERVGALIFSPECMQRVGQCSQRPMIGCGSVP